MTQTPTVGRIVHYVSYGTPNGEYPSVCRAAVVTAVDTYQPGESTTGIHIGHVSLCVLNPEGQFFNRAVLQSEDEHRGGTWHWPEREQAASAQAQPEPAPDEIGIYRERSHLIAYLATQHDAKIAFNDPDEPDWPVIYVDTPRGQLSWHLSPDDLNLFPHVPSAGRHMPADQAPQWDGHSTAEKYQRLAALVRDEA